MGTIMIPARDKLPEDAADWVAVDVDLPRLSPDSAESCPIPLDSVFDYVAKESADTGGAERERLLFVRTAQVASDHYWLWQYVENDGAECFVVVRANDSGQVNMGLSSPNGLSPEQYLLANHFDEIYWS